MTDRKDMAQGIVLSIHIAAVASAPNKSAAEVVAVANCGSIFF
jgi:hypothetical protein